MSSPTPSTFIDKACRFSLNEANLQLSELRSSIVFLVTICIILFLTIGVIVSTHKEIVSCNEISLTSSTHDDDENDSKSPEKEQKPSRRIRLTGLKTLALNGRLGWTTRFITSGDGIGRYHVVLDSTDDSTAPKEGNFWPKNLTEIPFPEPLDLTEKDIEYSKLCAKRVIIVGLKSKALNGRTGIRVRYITSGHGYGRFHVLLDGNHKPREGNFWPKNLLQLDEYEVKVGIGDGILDETPEGKMRRLFTQRPDISRKLLIKAKRSKDVVQTKIVAIHARKIQEEAEQHKAGFKSNIQQKNDNAQRRLTARLNSRLNAKKSSIPAIARLSSKMTAKMSSIPPEVKDAADKTDVSVDNDWD